MKEIIIIGGGFSGVAAAVSLKKYLNNIDARLTVIDRNNFHLFTPSLYEVATSEEPQKNIAIPLAEILRDSARLITGEVSFIDAKKQEIQLKGWANVLYDFLVISLGSESSYYNIKGLKEYSLPLKKLSDGVRIKDAIHKLCDIKAKKSEAVNIVIGGGGFSGTELASEMVEYREKLGKEHSINPSLIRICIIQGSDRLLKELDKKASLIAQNRLKSLGVDLVFGNHIANVENSFLQTDKGNKYPFDILIWTGGVRANNVLEKSGLPVNTSGAAIVNSYLQVKGLNNVFAVGDNAQFIDNNGKTVPAVAQVAEEEGKLAAENIYRLIKNKRLIPYRLRHSGYIVPLKGRFAIFSFGKFYISGFLGWIIQQIVVLRYFLGILPFYKAFRRWNEFEKDLRQE